MAIEGWEWRGGNGRGWGWKGDGDRGYGKGEATRILNWDSIGVVSQFRLRPKHLSTIQN